MSKNEDTTKPKVILPYRVLAGILFMAMLLLSLLLELWMKVGRDFLLFGALWIASVNAAKFYSKFPDDK